MKHHASVPRSRSRRWLLASAPVCAALLVGACRGGPPPRAAAEESHPQDEPPVELLEYAMSAPSVTQLTASRPGVSPDPSTKAVTFVAGPIDTTNVLLGVLLGPLAKTRLDARPPTAKPWPLEGGGVLTLELFRLEFASGIVKLYPERNPKDFKTLMPSGTWAPDPEKRSSVGVLLGQVTHEGGRLRQEVSVRAGAGHVTFELTDP